MTDAELSHLAPYFDPHECYLNGKPVEWATINYKTMMWMLTLRKQLGAPIRLIRGAHPNRPEAVDACCPTLSLRRVFMELCRIPFCSWGIYSGNSFHLDTREYAEVPARWMAVAASERPSLQAAHVEHLITSEKDGWLYLAWSDLDSWHALDMVFILADLKKARPLPQKI